MTAALPMAGGFSSLEPLKQSRNEIGACALSDLTGGMVPVPMSSCLRSRCSAARHRGKLYMFGGSGVPDRFSGGRLRSDVTCADTSRGMWFRVPCTGAAFPAARMHHITCVRDGHLVIHGGISAAGELLSDMWALPLDDKLHEWMQVSVYAEGCERPGIASHASTVSHGCLLMHGGRAPMLSPQLYRFTFRTQVLEAVECRNAGPLLQNHSLEVFGSVLYAYGGQTYHQGSHEAVNSQLFCCDLSTGVWRAVAFKLRGGVTENARDFLQPPTLLQCVRQTRQLWFVGSSGVYFAALPDSTADAVVFHTHSRPSDIPEARHHAVTLAVGRTLWVMFGEGDGEASGGTASAAVRIARHLAEDHVSTGRCFADVVCYSLDAGEFSSAQAPNARKLIPAQVPCALTSATTTTRLATPLQGALQYNPSKTSMLSRLLKEKHDFDKAKERIAADDVLVQAEIREYSDLLGATVEKYLDSYCVGPRKRVARRRRDLQDARTAAVRQGKAPKAARPNLDHLAAPLRGYPPREAASPAAPPAPAKTRTAVRPAVVPPGLLQLQACCRAKLSTLRVAHQALRRQAEAHRSASLIQRCERGRQGRRRADSRRAQQQAQQQARDLERRHAAACTIQLAQRRTKASSGRQLLMEQRAAAMRAEEARAVQLEHEAAARHIQRAHRMRQAQLQAQQRRERRLAHEAQLQQEAADCEAYIAAVKIQSSVRRRAAQREAASKRTAEQHRAAVRIQSMHRSAAARQEAQQRREENRLTALEEVQRNEAAARIQAVQRGRCARQDVEGKKKAAAREEQRKNEAATRIQAVQRGRCARNGVDEKKKAASREAKQRDEAATRIQAVQRGRSVRQGGEGKKKAAVCEDKRKNEAATRIQAVQRGRCARNGVEEKKKAASREAKQRNEAATRIQAVQRGRSVRNGAARPAHRREAEKEALSQRHAAATRIQRAQRTRSARQEVQRRRTARHTRQDQEEREFDAATRLQAFHRGNVARTEVARLRRQHLGVSPSEFAISEGTEATECTSPPLQALHPPLPQEQGGGGDAQHPVPGLLNMVHMFPGLTGLRKALEAAETEVE